jgi:hypothetical protein
VVVYYLHTETDDNGLRIEPHVAPKLGRLFYGFTGDFKTLSAVVGSARKVIHFKAFGET